MRATEAVKQAERPRILVVDDEQTNRELLEAMLTPAGYDVLHAESGFEALRRVQDEAVDLVILDVLMPGMSGFEVCRRVRNELRHPTLPVVMATALGDRRSRLEGKAAGADDFLMKPVDELELKVRLKTLLEAKAFHDLRERQRQAAEEEVQRLRDELVRAERLCTLGTLAAGVGHELNNIATVFLAAQDSIASEVAAGRRPLAEDLQGLQRAGEHLVTHARQLLALGRPQPELIEAVDVCEVTRAALSMLRTAGRTKYAEVQVDLPATPVMARLSRTRLEQVLMNLVANAADALEAVRGRPQRIRVALRSAAGCTHWRIEDTGCGIPGDKLQAVFEPYTTTKPPGRGTGLGLPVVKRIVEDWGGAIALESEVDRGTVVTFSLPAESRSSSQPA